MSTNEVPALSRGLAIIELVAVSPDPVAFGRIVRDLTLSKASATRLLRVLCDRQYLAKDERSGHYRSGPMMALLRPGDALRLRLAATAPAILSALKESCHNTVTLFYRQVDAYECFLKELHPDGLAMQPIGAVNADLCSPPWGWVLLAAWTPERIQDHIRSNPQYTAHLARRPGPPDAFILERIEEYRARGFAFDDQSAREGLRRMGVPVVDRRGELVAALGMAGTLQSIKLEDVDVIGESMKEAAKKLETLMMK